LQIDSGFVVVTNDKAIAEVGKNFAQGFLSLNRIFGRCGLGFVCRLYWFLLFVSAQNFYAFQQCVVFVAVFFVHHKVYHIQAFAVGLAVGGEAIRRVRFVVKLQALAFVVVERTLQSHVFIGLQTVIMQDGG